MSEEKKVEAVVEEAPAAVAANPMEAVMHDPDAPLSTISFNAL